MRHKCWYQCRTHFIKFFFSFLFSFSWYLAYWIGFRKPNVADPPNPDLDPKHWLKLVASRQILFQNPYWAWNTCEACCPLFLTLNYLTNLLEENPWIYLRLLSSQDFQPRNSANKLLLIIEISSDPPCKDGNARFTMVPL